MRLKVTDKLVVSVTTEFFIPWFMTVFIGDIPLLALASSPESNDVEVTDFELTVLPCLLIGERDCPMGKEDRVVFVPLLEAALESSTT